MSAQTRYYRAILAYRTALVAAGLQVPNWQPSIRGPGQNSQFSQALIDALKGNNNANSDNQTDYHQAAIILESAGQNQFRITWDRLVTVFTALSRFIDDRRSYFATFEQNYISNSSSHESWADPRLRAAVYSNPATALEPSR